MACANCSGRSSASGLRYPVAKSSAAPMCAETVACACCGDLETMCRPLWTAGMIVSEDDLNRLDHYMVGKQRLHNRLLHGVGVVSGLIVSCYPCGEGKARVSPGYALGPCGEDIIVASEDLVDICDLIKRCRAQERKNSDCRPWGEAGGCGDLREDWVLAIRYDEQPSRNAPQLRAGADCGCGGGANCSCGGAGKIKSLPSVTPSYCAPVVVCETYRYEVFRAPKPTVSLPEHESAILKWMKDAKIFECFWEFFAIFMKWPAVDNPQAWVDYCRVSKRALLDYMDRFGIANCAALAALCILPCPDPKASGDEFASQAKKLQTMLLEAALIMIKDCLCNKLLPALPLPACDPRLPLAVVTVDTASTCRVISICNWTPLRPIALTATAIDYWLDLFDIPALLRQLMSALCCAAPLTYTPPRSVGVVAGDELAIGQPLMAENLAAAGKVDAAAATDQEWQQAVAARATQALQEVAMAAGESGASQAMTLLARRIQEGVQSVLSGVGTGGVDVADLQRRIATLETRLDAQAGKGVAP